MSSIYDIASSLLGKSPATLRAELRENCIKANKPPREVQGAHDTRDELWWFFRKLLHLRERRANRPISRKRWTTIG